MITNLVVLKIILELRKKKDIVGTKSSRMVMIGLKRFERDGQSAKNKSASDGKFLLSKLQKYDKEKNHEEQKMIKHYVTSQYFLTLS